MSNQQINIREKLAIVIPTRNHREIMEEWMRIFPEQNKKANVEVWVYDSSDNDDTKRICELNNDFVHYIRCEEDMHIDEKTLIALEEVDKEYIWLCGDGIIPNVDLVYDILVSQFQEEIDLLHFFGKNQMNIAYLKKMKLGYETIYGDNEKKEFFRDFFWSLGCYGITILHRRLIENIDRNEILEKFKGKNFIYPAMMFCSLEKLQNTKCVVLHHNCFTANRKKIVNVWKQEGMAIRIFSKHIVLTVKELSEFYDIYKKQVIEEFCINNTFLTTIGLIDWRKENYYNLKEYKENKEYLIQVTGKSKRYLLYISILPKWACKLYIKYKRNCKKGNRYSRENVQ